MDDRRDERSRDVSMGESIPSKDDNLVILGDAAARGGLFKAIAKAKRNFTPIINDAKGQFGNRFFKYAPLDTLVACTEGALSDEGVTVMQFMTGPTATGDHRVTTIVAGCDAEIHSIIDYKRDTDMKQWGSQSTYIRRYAYRALFQLDGSDDADGSSSQDDGPKRDTRPTPPQAQQRPAQSTAKQPPAAPAPKAEPKPAAPPPVKEEPKAAPPQEAPRPAPEPTPPPAPKSEPPPAPKTAAPEMTEDQRKTIRFEAMSRGLTREALIAVRDSLVPPCVDVNKVTTEEGERLIAALRALPVKELPDTNGI